MVYTNKQYMFELDIQTGEPYFFDRASGFHLIKLIFTSKRLLEKTRLTGKY